MPSCPDVPPPKTLKDALDFAGALGQGNLKSSVGQKLQERVSEYAEKIAVDNYFDETLNNLTKLREKLDKSSGVYGSYSDLQNNFQPECLADAVSGCFPTLYCTLSYLHFNVNGKAQGGGAWKSQSCSSNNLGNWLKSKVEIPSASGQTSSATIWRGGFDSVKCFTASEFSTELRSCLGDQGGSKFEMLLSGILFLKPWLPELTSTFLVFVVEICIIISGEGSESEDDDDDEEDGRESRNTLHATFEKQYKSFNEYSSLTLCCKTVKTTIETLIGKEPGGDDGALHIPRNSHTLFKEKLNSDKISVYLQWLSRNLPVLIANLQQMEVDCTNWDPNSMPNGQVAGPFPYGFGFSKNWTSQTASVQKTLRKLTTDSSNDGIPALQGHVNKLIASSTSSSVASAVGGLLGTAAVGGAGASVALNVGGVTTALKGAIGIFK
ncbi:secreted antigen 1 [Babesia caballi]|uniref:Secreted antigen 1 n=1 Tax=Babesia caballi TaxID=5871 RepID=A0AAV4LU15_BABCB|nr:secreted antigen 1 [Babesia caballi]